MGKSKTTASASTASTTAPAQEEVASKPKRQSKKQTAEPASAPVSAPVVTAPVVASATEEQPTTEPVVEKSYAELSAERSKKRAEVAKAQSELRKLDRECDRAHEREMKAATKSGKNKKRHSTKPAGERKPSGFVVPTEISSELAVFLGKPVGTKMARTDVTKEINAYVKANKLQNPTNGREIIPDVKLAKLLDLGQSDHLTYFNLQKYIKVHFLSKKVKVEASVW
jgi:chromatin remodeling complex protein RSC6